MKKILVFLTIALLSVVFLVKPAHAQEVVVKEEAQVATMPAYLLPYPGILSDSPLYKIKLLRDKIWLAITQDPKKKEQLYLLFADKKIAIAKALAEKKQYSLAKDSALKGENELTNLTFYYKMNRLKPDASFLSTLKRASQKHRQVFEEIQTIVPQNEKDVYAALVGFSNRNEEEFGLIAAQE